MIRYSQTGDQLYSDTSSYKVSKCSPAIPRYVANLHVVGSMSRYWVIHKSLYVGWELAGSA